jgi:hypothetical protein
MAVVARPFRSNGRSIAGDDQLVALWWFEATAFRV